jgi:hypothetical protein
MKITRKKYKMRKGGSDSGSGSGSGSGIMNRMSLWSTRKASRIKSNRLRLTNFFNDKRTKLKDFINEKIIHNKGKIWELGVNGNKIFDIIRNLMQDNTFLTHDKRLLKPFGMTHYAIRKTLIRLNIYRNGFIRKTLPIRLGTLGRLKKR